MKLELFDFIEDVVAILEKNKKAYVAASNYIEEYFEHVLINSLEGYLNINCRVKTAGSLREKLIRNNFYKQYATPAEAIDHLSDLIGVRIECRFSNDEKQVFQAIKAYFNETRGDGYYYNAKNKKILLMLGSPQPQKQRNGFEIYRVDGLYRKEGKQIRFELQIKSLVNMFWGEIEHKVIYKNNNYMLMDKLFKDMLVSIKENLSMIDNQLMILYNQFNKLNALKPQERRAQIESVLSKIIYDVFAARMRDEIGFLVDFRRSCDAIMKYIFRNNKTESAEDYSIVLVNTLMRVNKISRYNIEFTSRIMFERDIVFNDTFEEIVGTAILKSINTDFHWNLFFRVLFEIEEGQNADDFEAFIHFMKERYVGLTCFNKLYYYFEGDTAKDMVDTILLQIAHAIEYNNTIEFIYEDIVTEIMKLIFDFVNILSAKIHSKEEWEQNKTLYQSAVFEQIQQLF